jgi:hypothetical protein
MTRSTMPRVIRFCLARKAVDCRLKSWGLSASSSVSVYPWFQEAGASIYRTRWRW